MGAAAEKEWFYLSMGHRRGPVTKDEVCDLIAKRDIYIDSTKVWKHGMEEWVQLAEAKDFDSYIKKVKAVAAKADVRVREASAQPELDEDTVCRGASRGLFNMFFYVGWLLPLLIGVAVLSELQVLQVISRKFLTDYEWVRFFPLLCVSLALWAVTSSRMKHAGYSKKFGWTIFVPVLNLWTLFICLCTPRNFGRKKKIGKAAFAFLVFFLSATAVLALKLVPGLALKDLTPLVVNDKVTTFYENKTNMTNRLNQNVQDEANVEARREQMLKQKEADARNRNASMREKRGL